MEDETRRLKIQYVDPRQQAQETAVRNWEARHYAIPGKFSFSNLERGETNAGSWRRAFTQWRESNVDDAVMVHTSLSEVDYATAWCACVLEANPDMVESDKAALNRWMAKVGGLQS